MVDKVFADWQGNPENEFPHLDTKRKIAPFGSKQFNKFTLTNIPPAKTLDYESNLCYCYDCDLKHDFDKVKLPKRERPNKPRKQTKEMGRGRADIEYKPIKYKPEPKPRCRPPGRLDEECKGVTFHKLLFTQITISVGITLPNHIGLEVNYRICFGNATCEKGLISVFGNPGIMKKNLKISSEHFRIQEDTVRMKLYTLRLGAQSVTL